MIDRVLGYLAALGLVGSAVFMLLNPLGYAVWVPLGSDEFGGVGVFSIHRVTLFGCAWVATFLYVKLGSVSLLKRLGLILAFGFIAYECYDAVWDMDFKYVLWGGLSLVPLQDSVLRFLVGVVVPIVLVNFFVKSIRIQLGLIIVYILLIFGMIGWLESTGFFQAFVYWNRGYGVGVDPHGWVWFAGKLFSFVAFPFTFLDVGRARGGKK